MLGMSVGVGAGFPPWVLVDRHLEDHGLYLLANSQGPLEVLSK